ncbi:MAG: acyl-ACP--UDP-N-acetylglucosamine O-acyltransferase [Gammaproteobacteria bacterium]
MSEYIDIEAPVASTATQEHPLIHPQAVIHPSARIAPDVVIGPWTMIGENVVIGAGTKIGPHVVINGPTVIGKNNRISQFASVGDAPQHKQYQGEPTRLEIGDNNIIREYCTLSRGTPGSKEGETTRIGNNNFLMAYTHVAHDCQLGSDIVFANGASLSGHVIVENHVILGAFCCVHQFCQLGAYSFITRAAMVTKDVAPYVLVSGNPAEHYGLNRVGLERNGLEKDVIDALDQAYRTVFRKGLTLSQALQDITPLAEQYPEVDYLRLFIEGSERGLLR